MRSAALVVGIAVVLLAGAVAPASGLPAGEPSDATPTPEPVDDGVRLPANERANRTPSVELVALAPNPFADGDAGEHVVLDVPEPTNATGWTFVDEAGTVVHLPNRTLTGRSILAIDPAAVAGNHSVPIHVLEGQLRLANGGDSIELRRPDGTVVDSVAYESAPEGEHYRRMGGRWTWRPAGATSFEPIATTPESARAFVLPDAPGVVVDELQAVDERILLAGYTLTSQRVTQALLDAQQRGVEVRVLLEGSPVGGVSERQVAALDRLVAAGVSVTILAGERDPFSFHHAKYAVVDDRALVLTENFKPGGMGGRSSRGWGVVLDDPEMASGLAELFRTDSNGPGAVSWSAHRSSVDPVAGYASSTSFPRHFSPGRVTVERARLLVAPDNAQPELADLLRSANESIRIQQLSIEGRDDPLLQASIAAARNGTEVEILLSSASYVRAENLRLVREMERLAEREGLPISADLVDPRGRFDKVHAKVAIVDGEHVVLGSLNWNPTAYGENREVVVVLTGDAVADYYAAVFEADSRDRTLWELPGGLAAAVCVLWLALAVLAVARIRWAVT